MNGVSRQVRWPETDQRRAVGALATETATGEKSKPKGRLLSDSMPCTALYTTSSISPRNTQWSGQFVLCREEVNIFLIVTKIMSHASGRIQGKTKNAQEEPNTCGLQSEPAVPFGIWVRRRTPGGLTLFTRLFRRKVGLWENYAKWCESGGEGQKS